MGIISRANGAPYIDGETLSGIELEGDFNTIYSEFNGNIDAANIKDGAITTAKLGATGITQAKLASGAATASEVYVNVTGVTIALSPDAAFHDVGNPITHTVGNPARHVIIMVSFAVNFLGATATAISIQMNKDGAILQSPSVPDQVSNTPASVRDDVVTRIYVDPNPTAGGSHIYQFRCLVQGSGSGVFIRNLHMTVFEPRS